MILGGGWREFVPKSEADAKGNSGFRTDNRNLIEEWLNLRRQNNANGVYVTTRVRFVTRIFTVFTFYVGYAFDKRLR